MIESFFGTYKQEWAHHHRWAGLADARIATHDYVEVFNNRRRLHSALGYKAPAEGRRGASCVRLSARPQVFARLSGSRATSVPSSAIGERLWSAEAGSLKHRGCAEEFSTTYESPLPRTPLTSRTPRCARASPSSAPRGSPNKDGASRPE